MKGCLTNRDDFFGKNSDLIFVIMNFDISLFFGTFFGALFSGSLQGLEAAFGSTSALPCEDVARGHILIPKNRRTRHFL